MTAELALQGPERVLRFETVDGLLSPDAFREPELRLLDAAWDETVGDLWCLRANYGVVGVGLGDAAESVRMTDNSARSARLCERNAAKNGVDAAVALALDHETTALSVDTVTYAPARATPIAVGETRIAAGLAALRPGGRLLLAAADRTGKRRYERALERLGTAPTAVDDRGDWTVLRAERPEAVDAPGPPIPTRLGATVDGVDLDLLSLPGLFSADELDAGTRLLLEATGVSDGERVLDLCSGYGAAGVYAALAADTEVTLTDDDRRATWCAGGSLAASGVGRRVVTADCARGVEGAFDRILCNPPTHAGNGVLPELFDAAVELLAADGVLEIVHHRELDLSDYFGGVSVARAADGTEHVVWRAER